MIQKVEKLTAIGKFHNYQAAGQVSFKKMTLIYAENGSGKTTLASVFRSLCQQDANLLLKRKTINSSDNQAVQIIQKDPTTQVITHHTFNHQNGWSNPFPEIEIFDNYFINANIYSGYTFTDDHRRKLHQFVIGAQGVAIKKQIEENKAAKNQARNKISQIESDIIQRVAHALQKNQISQFIRISEDADIDQKIVDAETNLDSSKSQVTIRQLPKFEHASIPSLSGLNWEVVKTDIQTDLQTLGDQVLRKIYDDHCKDLEDHKVQAPSRWLEAGFDYVVAKGANIEDSAALPCPFCQQSMSSDLNILQAYTQIFNEELKELISRIEGYKKRMTDFRNELSSQYDRIADQLRDNTERVSLWQTHLPEQSDPHQQDLIVKEELLQKVDAVINILTTKCEHPTIGINEIQAIKEFTVFHVLHRAEVQNYNQRVNKINRDIDGFKSGLLPEADAQSELDKLKRTKLRFDPQIADLCTQLQAEKASLAQLERDYPLLITQEENEATAFFGQYKNKINEYLTQFRTPFQIDEVKHIRPQGRATASRIGYKLTINGEEISFDPDDFLSTQECLSEGDKSTIALAFFLAKLDIDQNTTNKVIVFDDPLSSFDRNRRNRTVKLLARLKGNCRQVVILSHNEWFLKDIDRVTPNQDLSLLRIVVNPTTHASGIETLDLELLVEAEYFKNSRSLKNFLQSPDIAKKEQVLGAIRTVLEAYIKFRFYNQLPNPTNDTFQALIRKLEDPNQTITFRDNSNRTQIIALLKDLNDISLRPHHGQAQPGYLGTGVDPDSMTIAELVTYIQDTLELIDTRL